MFLNISKNAFTPFPGKDFSNIWLEIRYTRMRYIVSDVNSWGQDYQQTIIIISKMRI